MSLEEAANYLIPGLRRFDFGDDEDEEDLAGRYLEEGKTFAEILKDSVAEADISPGSVIEGTVIQISSDYVTVDIGYKSEGMIPIIEFLSADGKPKIQPGEKISVYLDKIENENGTIVLSREKAEIIKAWDKISHAVDNDEVVEGAVVAKVKGGLSVDIGVKAFLPGSQIDIRPVKNLQQYVGNTYKFKVIKFNRKRGNIVLSRRVLLEKERELMKKDTLAKIQEGQIITGIVKNITNYGAFIDLGALDGLLHITDMSWGRIKHPSELFKVGDEIRVKVLKYEADKERVSLGLKQIKADPWDDIESKYQVGKKVSGRAVSLTDYGAFVEIEEGVEGLVHVSEMSWTQRVKHPSKLVSPGQEVEALILELNKEQRRISLGMKQIEPNPWDKIAEKYKPGTKIKGTVRNVTQFGIFIGIEDGIDGMVHVSDISWDSADPKMLETYKVGDEVEAVVLMIDKEEAKFSLGIKQLTPDPWRDVIKKYEEGRVYTSVIKKASKIGVFVTLQHNIDGFIHVSELSNEKIEDPSKIYNTGDNITFVVLKVDTVSRKISLSVKALDDARDREEYHKHATDGRTKGGSSLFDSLDAGTAEKLKKITKKDSE